jgi:hypothetical protein
MQIIVNGRLRGLECGSAKYAGKDYRRKRTRSGIVCTPPYHPLVPAGCRQFRCRVSTPWANRSPVQSADDARPLRPYDGKQSGCRDWNACKYNSPISRTTGTPRLGSQSARNRPPRKASRDYGEGAGQTHSGVPPLGRGAEKNYGPDRGPGMVNGEINLKEHSRVATQLTEIARPQKRSKTRSR